MKKRKPARVELIKTKKIQFLVIFIVISLIFMMPFKLIMFSQYLVEDYMVDGEDLSPFVNFFGIIIGIFYGVCITAIRLVIEIITLLIFKVFYFKSMVIENERAELARLILISCIIEYVVAIAYSVLLNNEFSIVNAIFQLIWPGIVFLVFKVYLKKAITE